MTKQNYSFRLSEEKMARLDEIGKLDDRDRTYMVNKAIDLFLKTHAEKNGTAPNPKPTKTKKAAK
jgi:predicted transcriptional regulator